MLKVMFKCFEDHDGFPGCSAEFVNEKLLLVIEKAGMLPPLSEDWMGLDEAREHYGDDFDSGDIFSYPRKNINRWESENE